jgi:hypothetical protein
LEIETDWVVEVVEKSHNEAGKKAVMVVVRGSGWLFVAASHQGHTASTTLSHWTGINLKMN